MDLLRQALDLVRGAPFADAAPGSYSWAWSEQLVSDIEVAVTDTAERLALLALDAGEPELADWAARQGLKVVPGHEVMQQIRMRAAAQSGSSDGVDQAYREARRAARAVDADEELSEDTIRLYRQLSAALRQAGPHAAVTGAEAIDLRDGTSRALTNPGRSDSASDDGAIVGSNEDRAGGTV